MQRIRAILAVLALPVLTCASQPIFASPADLDPAFGSGGKVFLGSGTPNAATPNAAAFVLVQPDGRIIVLDNGYGPDDGVWRLNADGTPDTTFGNGTGQAVIPGHPCSNCRGVAEQSDGKIVVVLPESSVARLLPDGSLDPAFGTAGVASLASNFSFFAVGIAVAVDGRIVIGGFSYDSSGSAFFAFARFQANGALDATFGTGGQLVTQVHGSVTAFAQQPDGKLLLGGGDLVARFQADGGLDSSFGLGGVVRNNSPIPLALRSIVVQPDGNILVAGNVPILGIDRLAVLRIDPAGNRDLSFGANGLVTLQVDPDTPSTAVAIALDSRQRIVITGASGDLNQFGLGFRQGVVARLNPDGSPDAFFSAHGVTTFWDGYSSYGYAVAIQSSDRILVGSSSEGVPFFLSCGFYGNCLYRRTERAALFRLQGGEGAVASYVSEGRAIEYYYAAFGHYFISATPYEIASLDTRQAWVRTGQSFKVWTESGAGLSPVCRFFSGENFAPKSSHFYTPYPNECAALKTGTVWEFEGNVFDLQLPQGTLGQRTCPAGTAPLYRLYNNGQGGAPNHRYTDSLTIFNQMLAQGWIFEGEALTKVFACGPAP